MTFYSHCHSRLSLKYLPYTVQKPRDLGLCLELCRNCACSCFRQGQGQDVSYRIEKVFSLFLELSYLLIKYLCINSAVLHYTCRSHREYAPLLDMASFPSGGFFLSFFLVCLGKIPHSQK